MKMRQSRRNNRSHHHSTVTAATKKKKKKKSNQPPLECSHQTWDLCGLCSEATGRILLFLKKANWRYLENDTKSNICPQGNSNKDARAVLFFRTEVSGWVLKNEG